MSEEPTPYRAKPSAEQAQAILEAQALRNVFQLAEADRHEALAKLDGAALALGGLLLEVAADLKSWPALSLADLWAKIQKDPSLAKGAAAFLDPAQGITPEDAAAAYARALEEYAQGKDLRRIQAARRFLDEAEAAIDNPKACRAFLEDAAALVDRAEEAQEESPLDLWAGHLQTLKGAELTAQEAVRLNAGTRGGWADWFNAHLGPRGGLTPGLTMIAGGAPGAGKTSLAALVAVDAMAAGCPVLFWQLELGREETLEHLAAQVPHKEWWRTPFWKKVHEYRLPESWRELLTMPRNTPPEAEAIARAMKEQARKADRARRAGTLRHACNGLVVVDYAQLLTLKDRTARDAGHEVLTTAASRLTKTAADCGAVLLLLSQLNKGDQNSRESEVRIAGTAFAGADIARMAHCALQIHKARKTDGGKWVACSSWETPEKNETLGDSRLLTWTKTRGVWMGSNGTSRPDLDRCIWYKPNARALHEMNPQDTAPTSRRRPKDTAPTNSRRPMPENA